MTIGFRTSCPICHEIEAFNVVIQQCDKCVRITRPMPPVPSVRFNLNIYVTVSVAICISLLFVGSFLLQGKFIDIWKSLTKPLVKEKVKPVSPTKPQPPTQVIVYIVSKLQDEQQREESFITIGDVTQRLILDRANGTTEGKIKFTLPASTQVNYNIKTTTILSETPDVELIGNGEGTWSSSVNGQLWLWGDWSEEKEAFEMQLINEEIK